MARNKDSSKQMEISESSILSVSREIILENSNNKQGLNQILTDEFRTKKIAVYSADSDADTLIVKTVVESAKTAGKVVITNDTDITVLLWCHVNDNDHDISVKDENI